MNIKESPWIRAQFLGNVELILSRLWEYLSIAPGSCMVCGRKFSRYPDTEEATTVNQEIRPWMARRKR